MTLDDRSIPVPRRARVVPRVALLALALALTGCGGDGDGGGSSGQDGAAGVAGRNGTNGLTTLTSIALEQAGLNCVAGGNRISAGLDGNADGVLAATEVSSTQYVCNGTPGAAGAQGATGATGAIGATGAQGAPGPAGADGANGSNGRNMLIVLATEPAGANCTQAGTSVSAGFDTNADGLLEAGEVASTSHVCHGLVGAIGATGAAGPTGAAGANGADGATGAAGATGATGGAGADGAPGADGATGATGAAGADGATGAAGAPGATGATGADGALGSVGATGATGAQGPSGVEGATGPVGPQGPVGATGAIGVAGHNSLALLVTEANGANCQYGGKKVTSGIDVDDSGVLEDSEVQSTAYVCNGAPGPGMTVIAITANTQAVSFMGYVANSATQLSVTLPPAPTIGDIVDVTGAGSGGFRIAQNAGQSISVKGLGAAAAVLPGGVWTRAAALASSVGSASSATGQKVVATAGTGTSPLYLSADYGRTFTQSSLTTPTGIVYQVASSANGTVLLAAAYQDQTYVSLDTGATWTARPTGSSATYPVAMSADGVKMYAAAYGGFIYRSTDSGVSWTSGTINRRWRGLATSSDGTVVYAAPDQANQLYRSTDSGVSFAAVGPTAVSGWQNVSTSSDGITVAATQQASANIYVSTDGGTTWTARAPVVVWNDVRTSGDGNTLFATQQAGSGLTYTSRDRGTTWTPGSTPIFGNSVTHASMSTDANYFFSSGSLGSWSSPGVTTTVGTNGSLAGSQYDAISLQFVGGGLWVPRSYASFSGTFTIQ